MSIEEDNDARQRALDVRHSFIVQAPAGSGKTELLIQRLLALLNQVTTPEEILAITFTKKAANEMRQRVLNALKSAKNESEPAKVHAKKTWRLARSVLQRDADYQWNLLDNPNQLRIQTIDSLCTYLTKQLPLLSHFGSSPAIADQPQVLYREAVQEVLTHVEKNYEWSEKISHLLLHVDNDLNKLQALLVSLLAKRDQWLTYIHLDLDTAHIKQQLEQHLAAVITETLNDVRATFPSSCVTELLAIMHFASEQLIATHPDSPLIACHQLTTLPENDMKAWQGIMQLLLTKRHTWRKRVDEEIGFPALHRLKASEKLLHNEYRERFSHLMMTLSENETLRLLLIELSFLPTPYYQPQQWEILRSLFYILKIVSAELRLTFQRHGQIDFIENAMAARVALGNDNDPTDLALALDYQIRHILVDEFQDTSFSQYQLLQKLIHGWENDDGRTLFVVGDTMQSIYRFREAEVGLFIRMCQHGIGNIALTPLTLSVNFRSSAHLVAWNNKLFSAIFPPKNDITTGAVSYHASVAEREEAEATIPIFGLIDADGAAQAAAILAWIKSTQEHHPTDSMAILVRSRSHLTKIIPALKKAKIPFHAVDIDPLISRQTIQDLLALTHALLHPADRIAWLAILRAPWCGLTLADLLRIANEDAYAAIADLIARSNIQAKLSADGRLRLARIMPILQEKIQERGRFDLRSWIENTWILLGGPACLQDEADKEDVQTFFKLLQSIDKENTLLNLDRLKEKINFSFASTQHPDAYLQIMTIHSAKGLEFDSVILPHLERKMPRDDKSLLLWMERPLKTDKMALLLAPLSGIGDEKDKLYEYVHRQQRIKSDYETDRLLYVATTRAKKRLALFFNAHTDEDQEITSESGSFLDKIVTLVQPEITTAKRHETATTQKRSIRRLSTAWLNPIQALQTNKIISHQQQSGFQLKEVKAKIMGIVLHNVLQHMAVHGINWWQQKNQLEHFSYLHLQLKQQGLKPHELNEAVLQTAECITNVIADERGNWILQPHLDAKAEFAITAIIKQQAKMLVIDRTFVDEQGTRWIIDYKTTNKTPTNLMDFLNKQRNKYQQQMQDYHDAMRCIDERPIRLGLYFTSLPAWCEWSVDDN